MIFLIKGVFLIALISLGGAFLRHGSSVSCVIVDETSRFVDSVISFLPLSISNTIINLKSKVPTAHLCGAALLRSSAYEPREEQAAVKLAYPHSIKSQRLGVLIEAMNAAVHYCQSTGLENRNYSYEVSLKCSNSHIVEMLKSAEFPYMDIVLESTSERLSLARRMDAGTMTERSAHTEMSHYMTYVDAEVNSRDQDSLVGW